MIDSKKRFSLYYWPTPNGRKISIMLAELDIEYELIPVNIGNDEQLTPSFIKKNLNHKIPVLYDQKIDAYLMESAYILLYLSDEFKALAPEHRAARIEMMQWLFFQAAHIGPMLGQNHHFNFYNKGKAPYAEERYINETNRLYSVLEKRLEGRAFILDSYSIVDIAMWPWIARYPRQSIDLSKYKNVKSWYETVANREAVQRGYNIFGPSELIP